MSVYGMSRPDFYQNVIACLIKFCHLIGNAMPHILRTHDISAPISCLRERCSSPGVEYPVALHNNFAVWENRRTNQRESSLHTEPP